MTSFSNIVSVIFSRGRAAEGLRFFPLCILLLLPFLLYSCANIGNPSGGPRDEDPPIFVTADPLPGSVNISKNRMTLTFNELVNVKDAFSKVVVSPVGKSVPKVMSLGRKVTVTFDSLEANTTYTVDFADAIEDNNESNKLQGFAYTFSTGPELDSLRISGMVLDALTMEPQQEMIVGVTRNLADSAFTKLPLLRVAKTDDRGRFTIRGLKEGEYRVYALGDKDNDYKYANPEEDIAFYDFTVAPSSERVGAMDTIRNSKTGEIDSIINRTRTRYLPNDILLRSFNSQKRSQYLDKYERIDSTRLFFKMNTEAASLPQIDVIGYPGLMMEAILERNAKNDSLVYWLPRPLVSLDSIRVEAVYLRTDSTGNLSSRTDTLNFYPAPKRGAAKKESAKKNKKEIEQAMQDSIKALRLDLSAVTSSSHEVYQPVHLQFATPLRQLNTDAFHLETMVDTVWRRVGNQPVVERMDSLSPRDFLINYEWKLGEKYRITADSLAATGIYGQVTGPFTHEFTVKKKDEYCSLKINLSGLDPGIPTFVELLNSSDAVIRTEPVVNNSVWFRWLAPGKYYARLIEDYNGNGLFDTGDYDQLLQPDLAYYYPKAFNIKKNWDKEESWNVFSTPIDQMKPNVIKKNKPAADKRNNKRNQTEEEEEDDDYFDPTANPFDPNKKKRRNNNTNAGYRY
ncbi:MAG: Ig-like domain-containing protein [Muribaculaceae bacterium]|nr:Ig-like domain-containing protein [Muribaculaceae bacterium]